MKQLSREHFEKIIMKQFEIANIKGVTFEMLQADKNWLNKYTYTKEQNEEWMKWMKKTLKGFKGKLDKEINLDYGLKLKEDDIF